MQDALFVGGSKVAYNVRQLCAGADFEKQNLKL
jgi:hypothetical protein